MHAALSWSVGRDVEVEGSVDVLSLESSDMRRSRSGRIRTVAELS